MAPPTAKPMMPRIRPIRATSPPRSVPALALIRRREMNPMIAATGPSSSPGSPIKMTERTSDKMPMTRAA